LTGGKDDVALYAAQMLENTAGVALTQGGALLIALLSGGDYDEVSCSAMLLFLPLDKPI
jgi:hypothetical protein